MAITSQSGLREYNGDLSNYTGMLGGLTADIHTLRSLNPLTTNRVICVMYRAPYFLQQYYAGNSGNAYDPRSPLGTYKKMIEYYNTGMQLNIGDASLAPASLQGGFAGRSISIPTTQNAQSAQSFTINVPELCGRAIATPHNMWVDGIADNITGLTTYHGLVAGSVNDELVPQRIFAANDTSNSIALEPSPAWEVAEFLFIALDRSGARAEAATMALGCVPSAKVGNDIFNTNATGQSSIQSIALTFNCQFVQSTYVNDLAARYLKQFAVFGNSLNFNPGAGDAFFKEASSTTIDTAMFNGGKRPSLDAVQSALGNAPVFKADQQPIQREQPADKTLSAVDHMQIYNTPDYQTTTPIKTPYKTNVAPLNTNQTGSTY